MKPRHSILLMSLPLAAGLTAGGAESPERPSGSGMHSDNPTPGSILAAQVAEIALAKDLSRRAKNKQIASAIRLAVAAATAGVKNPDDALGIILDLVKLAAKAAPDFADIIPQAIPDLPVLSGITNLKDQVQDAVFAGVKAAEVESPEPHVESKPGKAPENPEFGGNTGDVVVSPSH